MSKEEIAEILLEIKAVELKPDEPFIFTSGIKSPIYCDNRLLMGHLIERRKVIEAFKELIEKEALEFDVIAGTATAGIPHAAWLSEELNAPMIYVRLSKKDYGKQNQIEGPLERGQKVLVIEDLVSTGKSSVSAVEAIKASGGEVENCVAIFTYGMKSAEDKFNKIGCKVSTLTDFETLVEVAVDKKYIKPEQKRLLLSWNKDPENWNKE